MGAGSRSRFLLSAAAALVLIGCGTEQVAQPTQSPAAATSVPATAPPPTPAPTPVRESPDIDAVMAHVRTLAVDIGLRNSGSNGDEKASKYISFELQELGWTVERRPFPLPQGGESWNVVATPPNFDERAPYLIVGGHYDSLNGPGANDNGTGVGIILELARTLDEKPADLPVVVVAFGAEERQPVPEREHHIGSTAYVANMSSDARRNLAVMVNVDMVGRGDEIRCGRISTGPREGTNRCLRVGRDLGIAVRERVTPDWSDHGSFAKRGMNTAWLWTGDDPCCYHSPRDTMDRVRVADVRKAAILSLAILRSYTR